MSRHGVRRERPVRGDVGAALADGRLVKVFAFRGSTQVMTPERAGVHLALRAASRMWERRSWQAHYGLTPEAWPDLREAVREAVEGGPRTPGEGANVVIAGGVVRGTWKVTGETLAIAWTGPADAPGEALDAELERVASLLDRPIAEAQVSRTA